MANLLLNLGFIELNVNKDRMIKNMKHVKSNINIETVF